MPTATEFQTQRKQAQIQIFLLIPITMEHLIIKIQTPTVTVFQIQ
jgi:hypothetical protein